MGDAFDVGMKAAARNKWIGFEKGNKDLVLRKVWIQSLIMFSSKKKKLSLCNVGMCNAASNSLDLWLFGIVMFPEIIYFCTGIY